MLKLLIKAVKTGAVVYGALVIVGKLETIFESDSKEEDKEPIQEEAQYKASLVTKDGDKFNTTVRAVSSEEALSKIINDMADGCAITGIKRI